MSLILKQYHWCRNSAVKLRCVSVKSGGGQRDVAGDKEEYLTFLHPGEQQRREDRELWGEQVERGDGGGAGGGA